MTTASNSDARKRLAARNTAPDTTGLREACWSPGCPRDGGIKSERWGAYLCAQHAVTGPDPTPEPDFCRGASDCPAALHAHGCFADFDGRACDDPDDHDTPEPDATVSDHAAAVATVQFSRETHVQWRDWMTANPDDARGPTVGLADYQQQCIDDYDNVLAVLRTMPERAWDEAVRAVAGVDPKAIHNPYRSES